MSCWTYLVQQVSWPICSLISQFRVEVFVHSGQLNNWWPNSHAKLIQVPLYQDPSTVAAKWNSSSLSIIIIYTWVFPILMCLNVPTWCKRLSWVIWWLLESYAYQNAFIHTQAAFWSLGLSHGSDHPGHRLIFKGSMSFVIYTHLLQKDCGDTPLPQIKLQTNRQFVQSGRAHVLLGGTSAILMWLLPGEGVLGLHLRV